MESYKNHHDIIQQQREREIQYRKKIVAGGFVLSGILHSAIFAAPISILRNALTTEPLLQEKIEEIEFIITDVPEEENTDELETPPEIEPEIAPEVIPAVTPVIAAVPAAVIVSPKPLAPDDIQVDDPVGEDAPSPELTVSSESGDVEVGNKGDMDNFATGLIASPDGIGEGFGDNDIPTGFAISGDVDGDLNVVQGGSDDAGLPSMAFAAAGPVLPTTPSPEPKRQPAAPSLVCVSCPDPAYLGSESMANVDMRIRPDGSVQVRLRESSGDPEIDRKTLETLNQWKFDPNTVPDGGRRTTVRVIYEEEGSSFQRRNEDRRREEERKREEERRRLAEQRRLTEQQRVAEQQRQQQQTQVVRDPSNQDSFNAILHASQSNRQNLTPSQEIDKSTTGNRQQAPPALSTESPSSSATAASASGSPSSSAPTPTPAPAPAPKPPPAPTPTPAPAPAPKPSPTPTPTPAPAPAPKPSPTEQ